MDIEKNNQDMPSLFWISLYAIAAPLMLQFFGVTIQALAESLSANNFIAKNLLAILGLVVGGGLLFHWGKKLTHQTVKQTIGKKFDISILVPVISCALGYIIVSSEIDNLQKYHFGFPSELIELEKESTSNHWFNALYYLLYLGVLEFVYRGFFTRYILLQKRSNWKLILLTIMTISIVLTTHSYHYFVMFGLNALFIFMYLKMRSIIPALVTIVIIALVPQLLVSLRIEIPGLITPESVTTFQGFQPIWLDILGIAALLWGIYRFKGLDYIFKNQESVS